MLSFWKTFRSFPTTSSKQKESDGSKIRSLVMVRDQLPAQVVKYVASGKEQSSAKTDWIEISRNLNTRVTVSLSLSLSQETDLSSDVSIRAHSAPADLSFEGIRRCLSVRDWMATISTLIARWFAGSARVLATSARVDLHLHTIQR